MASRFGYSKSVRAWEIWMNKALGAEGKCLPAMPSCHRRRARFSPERVLEDAEAAVAAECESRHRSAGSAGVKIRVPSGTPRSAASSERELWVVRSRPARRNRNRVRPASEGNLLSGPGLPLPTPRLREGRSGDARDWRCHRRKAPEFRGLSRFPRNTLKASRRVDLQELNWIDFLC